MNGLKRISLVLAAATAFATALASPSAGQTPHGHSRAFASNVVVPQSRAISADHARRVQITSVAVSVTIVEQVATTIMDVSLKNPTSRQLEAELLVPVPDGAVVKAFTFQGAASEPTAELLPKEQAVSIYKSIVASMRDPALLEFAGYNVIRSSVFPVEGNGTQKVRLTYENLLAADGPRVDYLLPRTESIDYRVPWEVAMSIRSKQPISTVYSSSHMVSFERIGANAVTVKLPASAMAEPGPLQLSYLVESGDGVTASLFAYPDPKVDGGYFLLLAGLPASTDDEAPAIKREITVVIDRSGSMRGQKMEQAREAALQVLQGLDEGDTFNIIDYSDSISSFAAKPVAGTRENLDQARHYVRRISAAGGTNIHDALIEALRPAPPAGALPIVLFLTDGLPTVGVRDEAAIRQAVIKANTHNRRIFSFGVGYDVNAPLLTHLARNSRAVPTFVLPNEQIEARVSQVYRRLNGPVLAEPKLEAVEGGRATTTRVRDLMPAQLPDLFEGDQLVLLGKYVGDQPVQFRLTGNYRGKPRTFTFNFQLDKATTKNSFVPRLWASRKIGVLIDEIRQAGAAVTSASSVISATPASDPKMKELTDEIVRLSLEFGILTEYTAFLAREGTDLARKEEIIRSTTHNLNSRAVRDRGGQQAVNQDFNTNSMMSQTNSNRLNKFVDAEMNRVQVTRVQQINDRAFFQQGPRWIDGNVLNSDKQQPDSVVKVGTPQFARLLDRLVAENRQGVTALDGEILIRIDGQNVLIKGD